MKKQIVLGAFFGDEGKGSTVQWLCKEAINRGEKPLVVRFSGGPQAGHRIVYNGKEHICSSYGSGVLLNVDTALNENVFVDPICIKKEYEVLQEKGITPDLTISFNCRCITPYDVFSNLSDTNNLNNGSCGMGIYQTYKRCKESNYSTLLQAVRNPEEFLNGVREYHKLIPEKEFEEMFKESIEWLLEHASFYEEPLFLKDYDTIIYEGSQGLLLDMDHGFMPNCTPSKVGLNGLSPEVLSDAEIFFVMRPYITRHGNGYIPQLSSELENYFTLEEPSNLDTGIQGVFKRGVFDFSLLKTSFDRHCLSNYQYKYHMKFNIVLTHVDCINNFDKIPVLMKGDYKITSLSYFDLWVSLDGISIEDWYYSYNQELTPQQFVKNYV